MYLQFDSGTELLRRTRKCHFSDDVSAAQKDIQDGWYKEFYKVPTMHTAYVDTIEDKVAIIFKPTIPTKETVGVSIKDCETGASLEIRGENLSEPNEVLVLSIFKTLKFEKHLLKC